MNCSQGVAGSVACRACWETSYNQPGRRSAGTDVERGR